MILIELGFFQGHGSSPESFPELQKEPTHQGKIRQLVSHVQSKVKVKKAQPEEKVYDGKIKLSKKKIRQLASKSKLTEDEYCKPESSLIFGKQLASSLISKDTKMKGYFYIQFFQEYFR